MFKLFNRKKQAPNSSEFSFPIDVLKQIKMDFKENADEAQNTISKALEEHDYLKVNRIIRCIIYLAKGNLEELERSLKTAIEDPRDVMFWAEYINFEKKSPDRIRDFNKPFGSEEELYSSNSL